jgi:hypothetical protein
VYTENPDYIAPIPATQDSPSIPGSGPDVPAQNRHVEEYSADEMTLRRLKIAQYCREPTQKMSK